MIVVAAEQVAQRPEALTVVATVLLFIGIVGLLGLSAAGMVVFDDVPRRLLRVAPYLWIVAALAAVWIAEIRRASIGASLGEFLDTPLGHAAVWRGIGALVAYEGVLVALVGRARARRLGFGLLGVGAVIIATGDGLSSHAAAGGWTWLKIADQTIHVTAVGCWIGGLAALLIGIAGAPDERKARAVRRFSMLAGVALFIVAATGIVRGAQEVGSVSALLRTDYGRMVILKVQLLIGLAIFGALNRFRHVPVAGRDLRGLRAYGAAELGIALIALTVTGVLSGTAPGREVLPDGGPVTAASTSRYDSGGTTFITVEFSDGSSVQLYADPGTPGANEVHVTFFDAAGAESSVASMTMRATKGSRSVTGDVRRLSDGHFVADVRLGRGRWDLTIAATVGSRSIAFDVRSDIT